MADRKLKVFLCHASQDKPAVRELYQRLKSETWIEPWLDEESLLPGQDFDLAIYKATRDADAIIICLSKISVAREGYVNREIRHALNIADEKPEGAIYVIPLRLDDCTPSFERLNQLHWVDYFTPNAHERLIKSLRVRAEVLKIIDLVAEEKLRSKAEKYARKELQKRINQEAREKVQREMEERLQTEVEARTRAELEAREKAVQVQVQQEAAEKVNREQADWEVQRLAAENDVKEKAELETQKRAERKKSVLELVRLDAAKAEREAELAVREQAEREAQSLGAEKTAKEKAELEAQRLVAEMTTNKKAEQKIQEQVVYEQAQKRNDGDERGWQEGLIHKIVEDKVYWRNWSWVISGSIMGLMIMIFFGAISYRVWGFDQSQISGDWARVNRLFPGLESALAGAWFFGSLVIGYLLALGFSKSKYGNVMFWVIVSFCCIGIGFLTLSTNK